MQIRTVIPFIIGILFLGTAAAPFLSANITTQDFGLEYKDEILFSETGTAKRTFKEGTYTLEIDTNLENQPGEYYTAWLIRLNPFTNINLGTLEQGDLSYTEENSETDYKAFTEIIITLESTPDAQIPDKNHIIEGSFNNL